MSLYAIRMVSTHSPTPSKWRIDTDFSDILTIGLIRNWSLISSSTITNWPSAFRDWKVSFQDVKSSFGGVIPFKSPSFLITEVQYYWSYWLCLRWCLLFEEFGSHPTKSSSTASSRSDWDLSTTKPYSGSSSTSSLIIVRICFRFIDCPNGTVFKRRQYLP